MTNDLPPPEPVAIEDRRRGLAAGKVLLGGLLGLGIAIVLNSEALLRDARQKPFGVSRDVSVAVWEPVEGVASALGLTAPRGWADAALGRELDDEVFQIDTATDVTASEPRTLVSGVPTPSHPLDLWIVGDSMVQFFGETMAGLANDTGVIDATAESKLSSGLSRPDFFDWPERLNALVLDEDPGALVIMYGGNDAQGLVTPDGVAQPFSELWVAEYSRRVGAVMDLVTASSDRRVLWVGQPIMRSSDFDAKMRELNTIYEVEAAKRPQVSYVSTRALFATDSGGFDRYLPDESGELVDVRLSDGIHLSTEGGRWLSELLLDKLAEVIDIESGRGQS